MRLQKYMAMCGVASRRKSEELILDGKVTVNGEKITELGYKVAEGDIVKYDGRIIKFEEKKVYVILNKPIGYITSVKDEKGRKTVLDLIEGINERIYPVGRLDYDTTGLLLLTNDGELTHKLTHPKHEVKKTYVARLNGSLTEKDIQRLENGVVIDGYKTSKAEVNVVKETKNTSVVEIKIHEGRNRQVRKMFKAVGRNVLRLKRVKFGSLSIEGLKEGDFRELSRREIDYIKKM